MWCDGLSLDDWCDKHEDDSIDYLHGYCDEWVRKHYLEGDQCVAITEYDKYICRKNNE